VTEVPEILYVCVHNAGRSQMAAALTQLLGGSRVRVRSAGSMPGEHVHPVVVEAMREIGVDLAHELPKLLTPDAVSAADVVITMGCGDACPVFPGKSHRDWKVDDPKGRPIEDVRRIRDDIRGRVEAVLRELGVRVEAPGDNDGPPHCEAEASR
jgi:arsenate reductase